LWEMLVLSPVCLHLCLIPLMEVRNDGSMIRVMVVRLPCSHMLEMSPVFLAVQKVLCL